MWTKHTLTRVALALVALGNVRNLPTYRDVMLASRWFPHVHAQSALLKLSLERGNPQPTLGEDYRVFYDFCTTVVPKFRSHRSGSGTR